MKRALAALVLLLGISPLALAHEGHDHRIMGTVSAITGQKLEVKAAKGGGLSTVVVNEKTKLLRDKSPVSISDVKVGDRVVVTAVTQKDDEGKERLVAKEVRLGTTAKESAS